MTRWMNMWGMCFNIFSLPCSFLCGGAGYEPSCLFCVCVCVLKYLCVALVMCFGDAPVVNARLPLSLIPSHSLSLCSVSCVQIIFGDSSGFFSTVSSFPLLCLLSPSLCFSVEASSSTPKAIHFSGLFENRLLHFILAVHKHHCATQTSKWFNTEQRRTVMLLIFICADSSVSLQSYNWLVLKLKNPITVLPAVYSFIIVCDSWINPHLVQTLKVRCH